jgi:hypothetical protein
MAALKLARGKLYRKFRRFLRRPERACILGGEYFFIDELPLEKLLKSGCNVERFVKLRVEAVSPFALSEVIYGFFRGKSKLTIFIAYKRRVEAVLAKHHSYIFPEFLPRLLLGRDFAVKSVRVSQDGSVIFSSASEVLELKSTDAAVFDADLREWKTKKHAQILRNFSNFLNCGIGVHLVALPIACLCLGYLLLKDLHLDGLKQQIEAKKPAVNTIVSKHALLESMSKFFSRENFCLASLEEVNRVRRDDILFTDVRCDSDRKSLKIRGHAQSTGAVSKYCAAVKRCPGIKGVEASNVHSHDRTAFFTIDIYFE